MQNQQVLKEAYQKVQLIALTMLGGCFMLVFVFCFLKLKETTGVTDNYFITGMVLIAGIVGLFLTLYLKNQMLNDQTINPPKDMQACITKLTTVFFIGFAITEGCLFSGVILGSLRHQVVLIVGSLLIAGIGFYINFPRLNEWEDWIQKQNIK